MKGSLLRFYLLLTLGLIAFPLIIHPIGGYPGVATQILILGIAGVGFNLLLGYAGLLSYGQAMFYGLGSYVGLLTISKFFPGVHEMSLGLLLAVLFVTAAAFVIGALTVRLYGIYFALLTLAFAQMTYFVVFQSRGLTGGDDGLQGITAPPLLGIDLTQKLPAFDLGPFGNLSDVTLWYVFVAVVFFIVVIFFRKVVASQFGEVLAAIRENELRSTFVGFNPTRYKLAAFTIAGMLTGLSGALKGFYDTSTAPDTLTVEQSGNFVVYAVVGGLQTVLGPLLGTGIVLYLQNVISGKTDAWRLIEGLIFVGIILFMPGGVLGLFKSRREVAQVKRTIDKALALSPAAAPEPIRGLLTAEEPPAVLDAAALHDTGTSREAT
jgi:ABC-type branched-subunit amino acid transport system permease subunit